MTFQHPIYLLALLLIPAGILLALLSRSRRKRYAVRLPGIGALAAFIPREAAWKRVLPAVLLGGAVAALAVALTKPEVSVAVPVPQSQVMLVTDVSGSMQATDIAPSRLGAAQKAVGKFLSAVPGSTKVGLMTYSDQIEANLPPTTDHGAVKDAISTALAGGGTATGDALQQALTRLTTGTTKASRPPTAIVLLSDGSTSEGVDPVQVAAAAKAAGISISTVALGTPGGTVDLGDGILRPVPPDPALLKQIADVSGGQAFNVQDAGKLSQIYKQVGTKLGTEHRKREVTSSAVGLAAILMLGSLALGIRRRPTLA